MTLYTKDGFKGEALLALQHLTRIGRTQNVKWWVAGVAMIPASTGGTEQEERVALAQAVWNAVNAPPYAEGGEEEDEEGEVVDAWDRKNFSKAFDDTVERARIPDYRIFGKYDGEVSTGSSGLRAPPCVVVEVDALPRYASIEWACTGLAVDGLQQVHTGVGGDSGNSRNHQPGAFEVRDTDGRFAYSVYEIPGDGELDAAKLPFIVEHGTLYASSRFDWKDSSLVQSGVSWVPCKRVWGQEGRELRGVLVAKRG
jgi:diphthine-ammonia ligase